MEDENTVGRKENKYGKEDSKRSRCVDDECYERRRSEDRDSKEVRTKGQRRDVRDCRSE